MTAQTDHDFIYDYLIYLDSFLLHGISEINLSNRKSSPPKSFEQAGNTAKFQNHLSPIIFISSTDHASNHFSNNEEKVLFEKMVTAMNIQPESVYILKLSNLQPTATIAETLALSIQEKSFVNAKFFISLGFNLEKIFAQSIPTEYHLQQTWQPLHISNQGMTLATIPTLHEMLSDARYKKVAWAHLKRISQMLENPE